MISIKECLWGGKNLSIEYGRVARQANGAVLVRYGETVVLVTAVVSKEERQGIDFFPLTVDYQEKAYAAGKIPGGFFKREGRPRDKETLTARLVDRPLRPLFPDNFRHEVQIIGTVLSADQQNDPDILAVIGASAALTISNIPFSGPIAAARVGRLGGQFILNPTYEQLEQSDMDVVVAGTQEAIIMVEGEARELPEEVLLAAMEFGHQALGPILQLQKDLAAKGGKPKMEITPPPRDPELEAKVKELSLNKIRELLQISSKEQREEYRISALTEILSHFPAEDEALIKRVKNIFQEVEKKELRRQVLEEGVRADGRKPAEMRQITCEIGILPRTHGSALFTRGQTQAVVVTTLGTTEDEQRLDDLEGEGTKRFMLHYNFPPYSVGEVRFMRGPGRREIGHGALAERSLLPVLPTKDEFPYTLRIVSDILESNGSSSMATVCGASLSLMDAGAPVKAQVAGVAMGLIQEKERSVILTDIMGIEDHLGDMDFKVAGTRQGITALQMDNKSGGVPQEVLKQALMQAQTARFFVLDEMYKAIEEPRSHLSAYAPRIIAIKIPVDKIREVIGPGGKMIKSIIDETGVKINIEDDGSVQIASVDEAAAQAALAIIQKIVEVPEINKVYHGKVKKIMEFGAFVEILPNTDGLLHISQIAPHRVKKVEDELKEGDEVWVKVIDIDKQGKIRLSHKELLKDPQHADKVKTQVQ
jgi:polyribonucleotide nucleotidyltransferase